MAASTARTAASTSSLCRLRELDIKLAALGLTKEGRLNHPLYVRIVEQVTVKAATLLAVTA